MKEKVVKISLIIFSIIAIAGTVGFGVYSYYYYTYSYSSVSNDMNSGSFKPEFDGYFIGTGEGEFHDYNITCDTHDVEEYDITGNYVGEHINCSGDFTVTNNGSGKVKFEIENFQPGEDMLYGNVYLREYTFSVDDDEFTLDSNEEKEVHVDLTLFPDYKSDVAIESESGENDIYYSFDGTFKIKATQVFE